MIVPFRIRISDGQRRSCSLTQHDSAPRPAAPARIQHQFTRSTRNQRFLCRIGQRHLLVSTTKSEHPAEPVLNSPCPLRPELQGGHPFDNPHACASVSAHPSPKLESIFRPNSARAIPPSYAQYGPAPMHGHQVRVMPTRRKGILLRIIALIAGQPLGTSISAMQRIVHQRDAMAPCPILPQHPGDLIAAPVSRAMAPACVAYRRPLPCGRR